MEDEGEGGTSLETREKVHKRKKADKISAGGVSLRASW